MALRLYHSPGSCSTACHIALEASGLDYEIEEVSTKRGDNFAPAYLALNPAGKVPALRLDDGSILTENPAILLYVASLAPGALLLPDAGLARARANEWLNFLSSGVHIAYRSIFRPERLSTDAGAAEGIRARGFAMLADALAIVETRLAARSTAFAVADRLSVVDPYLLIYWLWRRRPLFEGAVPSLPSYDALAARLLSLAEVRRVLDRDGLAY